MNFHKALIFTFLYLFSCVLLLLTACSVEPPVATTPDLGNVYSSTEHNFSLEYPDSWVVMDREDKGMGVIISAQDQENEWGGTNLNLNYNWSVGDVGMGWEQTHREEITNQYGIDFTLSYNKVDEDFDKEFEITNTNVNDVMITIGTDAIPGLKMFSYNTEVNPNGEEQLKEILESVKKIN